MKLIVTGANGFIGKHLCRRLQSYGLEFVCLIRSESSTVFFDENNIPFVRIPNRIASLTELINKERASGVVHLASHFVAEHQESDVDLLVTSNVLFGTQLLEASVKAGVNWFLNTGTFWQHYNGSEYDPVNLYAATKQAMEDIGRFYANAHNLRFCTLKLNDTYGPDDTRNKIYKLWDKIAQSGEWLDMSPGEQLIDIVHVDLVVDGYIRLIVALDSGHINTVNCESYFVSSNKKITLKELAVEYETTNHVKLNINWGGRKYRRREVMSPSAVGRNVAELPFVPELRLVK